MSFRSTLVPVVALLAAALPGSDLDGQTPTRVMVRVTANDAKIIGAGVGGARVTIREAATGEVLAEGTQGGGTGDTGLIMGTRQRGVPVFDTEGAGGFLAEVMLDEPTWVEITGEGPLGTPDALRSTTRTTLLIPGRDVVGDGIILELLGFTVELREPAAGAEIEAGAPVTVEIRLTMLCGCPTRPGGVWDSDGYQIIARVHRGADVEQEVELKFSGETSVFTGVLHAIDPGEIELEVLAIDAARGNFGQVRERFTVVR